MRIRLKHINTLLLVGIILLNSYTILLPFWPNISFWWQSQANNPTKTLQQAIHQPPRPQDVAGTRLVVPAMQLDQTIHEVPSVKSIRDDIWRRPNTSTPSSGGNTVLVGHRFTYTNPNGVFYHLNKLQKGDEIAVTWQAKRYVYKVREIKVTKANDSVVEAPTNSNQITLYTCTPLWNPTQRLVVVAPLEKIYE
jgi:LPXTG-site transpeptidase (sortase) family protein